MKNLGEKLRIWTVLAIAIATLITLLQPRQVQSQMNPIPKMQEIRADDLATGDLFGFSVAVKNNYGLVGAPFHDADKTDAGAAYLFDLSLIRNKQVKKLTLSEGEKGSQLGYAVALNDKYALVSQPYGDANGTDSGSAYLFALESMTTQGIPLVAEDLKDGDLFGYSAAANNNYALIGAPYQDTMGVDSGAVYLFDVITKKLLYKFVPEDGSVGDLFGYSVAIADNFALISAPYRDERGIDSGVVYSFDLQTGKQLGKIFPTEGGNAGDLFGFSLVALESGQSKYALVSAPYRDSVALDSGTVYLFDLTTGQSIGTMTPDDLQAGDVFGRGLSLFGNEVLIGAPYQDNGALDTGAAYIFNLNTSQEISKLTTEKTDIGSLMGYAVGGDAEFGLIGAPYADSSDVDSGLVYLIK